MKTFTYLVFSVVLTLNLFQTNEISAQVCCPDFVLRDKVQICPTDGACSSDPAGFGHSQAACKQKIHTYTVFPNDPSFTYSWTVTGGTPTTFTGNPINILWGNGATGFIKVVITSNNPNLNCSDTITMEICLIDGPMAGFTLSPDTVCVGTPVTFTNTSTGGSLFVWNFGDGTTYTGPVPPNHSYSAPGTYTVLLTVQDMGAGQYLGGGNGENKIPCGCSDTATAQVVVLPGTGPEIETDCCYGTVCPGDTSYLCTPMVCNTYNWSVTGGGIIVTGAGTSCIAVKWPVVYSGPTTVTLQSCATSTCAGSTTINVPVLYPNLPISGPTTLCIGASGTYSLPLLPGTYYNWTVIGGPYSFNEQDKNVPIVNISFLTPGSYWVKCQLQNPLAGCDGVDSIQVNVLPKFSITGDDKVCEGTQAFYFAPGPTQWTFSPSVGPVINSGQGTGTLNVSFPPGNFTVIGTFLGPPTIYCNMVATKNVQVIAKPILGNITGPDSVCTGSNYVYKITSNTSGSPFVWLPASGVTFITQMGDDNDSVVVQFSGAGPWTLQVYQEIEISPGNFCQSLTKSKVVQPFLPPVITGPLAACVDAVATYYASGSNPPGGFQWSISPPNRGTILVGQGTNTVQIKWHGPATTATITVTNCAGFDTHNVTISDPPIAVATPNMNPVFCLGTIQTLIISTPFNGGYTYQWYENSILMSGQTSSTLSLNIASFTQAGVYSYYVVVTNGGCSKISNVVYVSIQCCSQACQGGGGGGCDATAFFTAVNQCSANILLTNLSSVISPATITNYQWSISGPGTGIFTPNANAQNPGLSVTASGTYTITLVVTSSTGCTSTYSLTVNVLLPNISFTTSAPACINSPIIFTPNPNSPGFSYFWTFGDGSNSYDPVTQHMYTVANNYKVKVVISDGSGCTATDSIWVTVNPTPVCSISTSAPAFCPGGSVTLTACSGMSSYQWYRNGSLINGANSSNYSANLVGEYYVEVTNSYGCSDISNKIFIYMLKRPKAKVEGDGYYCSLPGGSLAFGLSTYYDANYTYSWSCIPGGATFSPNNASSTWVTLTVPFTLPAYYQFIVNVTDQVTNCTNADTLCVTVYETPALIINSNPPLDICEGTPVTLTPNIINPSLFSYLWNNGATTPVITVSNPGTYTLTITNKATGCSATAVAGTIHALPDLRLFPIGCDHLCAPDTLHLYIPLPLNWLPPFNNYPSAYPSITWYDYNTPVGSGQFLNFPATTSGNHQFSVVVQNQFGCIDSAGVFCLYNGCCNIVLESLTHENAKCPELPNGSFTIVLNPSSTGGPFTITSSPLVFPFPTTIIPGNPLTVSNLAPGVYTITVSGVSEGCTATYQVVIGTIKDICCTAEYDSLYTKILVDPAYTSDVVWDGKYYIDNNVIVTVSNGATLDITNVDVVFGECAGILFTGGAMLRSNNSVYRPCEVDKTWRGLRFVGKGKFDNIVNECTFKNAEVALYFQQNADAVVSNNLFSNCNYGVRVEGNNSFNHPISGNRFVTEQFFPDWACPTKYGFVNNASTYGIFSKNSRFLQQVSQNNFINTWGNSLPRTFGIYQLNGGGIFSFNTFTDLSYSIYLNTAVFNTILENNQIEINELVNNTNAPIFINTTNGPIIEINNSEISDNYRQFNCFAAIYVNSSSKLSITANQIYGFRNGIYVFSGRNIQVSRNIIEDSDETGIYFRGKGNFANYITCNDIRMRNFTNSRGILTWDLTTGTEISSNCVNDCYIGMDIRANTNMPLPRIRNNFLYNYNLAGINVFGHSGNIGTLSPPDPGLNTLWSNYNSAIDINSNTNITVADNFGMFNISWPQVQIVSNRPYHSTASCAQQIFNMPSQGNLNVNYVCDNFKLLFPGIGGSGGQYTLAPGYLEILKASETPFEDAAMILATVDSIGPGLFANITSAASLTDNEAALLRYYYFYRNSDYDNARLNIMQFNPSDADESDFKSLVLLDLDIIQNGWDIVNDADVNALNIIREKGSYNSNFAISILNNSQNYLDYQFHMEDLPGVMASADIKHYANSWDHLVIRPNPAMDKVFIDYMAPSDGEIIIQVYDISGKEVLTQSVPRLTGSIELDIHNLETGFYFVSLTDKGNGAVKTGKLVKAGQSGK